MVLDKTDFSCFHVIWSYSIAYLRQLIYCPSHVLPWVSWPLYPRIEATTFDLIAMGTSLPQCTIAATASACGKTVLLDPSPSFGSHYTSLSIPKLELFLNSNLKQPYLCAIVVKGHDY